MPLYHFGSRQGLLAAVTLAVEEAERATVRAAGTISADGARRFRDAASRFMASLNLLMADRARLLASRRAAITVTLGWDMRGRCGSGRSARNRRG